MPRVKPLNSAPSLPHPPAIRSLIDAQSQLWTSVLTLPYPSSATATSFVTALHQILLHPEHNSSWILRADVLYDSLTSHTLSDVALIPASVPGFTTTRSLIRRFIPRNPSRDAPATQTCHFLTSTLLSSTTAVSELVLLLPHEQPAPYYLPAAAGIAFLLSPSPDNERTRTISLSCLLAPSQSLTPRLERTALHLLTRALKVSNGIETGYTPRVHHDLIVPRETFQDLYLSLRSRHAPRLVSGWKEKTDPSKHVFEDILIASFLICLWSQTHGAEETGWVGFVDIGCGNGVLVDVLVREGWSGWGFDARRRKSWGLYPEGQVKELLLCPGERGKETEGIHDGTFPEGTFLVSNHADELTPWTPLLAKGSSCPFMAIPCCSFDLAGRKKRHEHSQTESEPEGGSGDGGKGDLRKCGSKGVSTYAGLVAYTEYLARSVGWAVEREVLRIPSTRNVAIIGRTLGEGLTVEEVVKREGGYDGWRDRVEGLRKAESGH